MASQLHCAYCFENLVAHFEDREALSSTKFLHYWKKFAHATNGSSSKGFHEEEQSLPGDLSKVEQTRDSETSPDGRPATHEPASDSDWANHVPSTSTEDSFDRELEREFPLFVTWTSSTAAVKRQLRGCKGTFHALPLSEGLADFALVSALEDARFAPIEEDELPSLTCEITLLQYFEPCKDLLDWEIGKHGFKISFEADSKRFSATYLPDVMPQQGWDQQEAIISAVRKSGSKALSKACRGTLDKWSVVESLDIKLTRYQGMKSRMTWSEWERWRSWIDGGEEDDSEEEAHNETGESETTDGE